jgi:nickel transport protein
MKQLSIVLSILLLCLVIHTPANAHKVNVFAYAEAGTIIGETSFSGGRPAQNAEISVQDRTTGAVLLQTRSDSQGAFSFPVPDRARTERLDLLIVAGAGEGHRNEWLLTAEDYLPGEPDTALGGQSPAAIERQASVAIDLPQQQIAAPPDWSEEQLQQIIETAVEKQVAPLKRLVLETRQSGPGLRDILGGIGYIVGIFGVIALIKSQKGEK